MTKAKTPSRGGKRPGAGRPKKLQQTARLSIYITPEQKAKALRAGGSEWFRRMIDAAPESAETQNDKETN